MEARALADELHEHRDGAVRLRARLREEAVGDLALHHHAPELDLRQAVEALDEERRRDVVRQVRDELRRVRCERGEIELQRVAEVELDVRAGVAQVRLERRVELDRVHARDAVGEVARQHAEAGPDLEHDVVRRRARRAGRSRRGCSRRRGSAGRATSSASAHHSPKHSAALRSICARARADPRRAPAASAASVCMTYAGSFGLPRIGCGARYGASVSARIRSAGTCARGEPQVDRLREGRVAGERDVPAALERRLEQVRRGEAVQDDAARRSLRAPRACRRRPRACG